MVGTLNYRQILFVVQLDIPIAWTPKTSATWLDDLQIYFTFFIVIQCVVIEIFYFTEGKSKKRLLFLLN